LRQLAYGSAGLKFSDHRPVYGLFEADVALVDDHIKDTLSLQLYEGRRREVGVSVANNSEPDLLAQLEKKGDLGGRPYLPPPSSDRDKWWLDGTGGSKVRVDAPPRSRLNPNLPKNPFTPNSEPTWVPTDAPTPPPLPRPPPKPSHLGARRIDSRPPLPPRPQEPAQEPLMDSTDGAISWQPLKPM